MASTIKVDNILNQDADRYGAVAWDTTAKTAAFTAENGKGYFVNTTSGAITVTLPASPSAGDIVAVSDYAQTAETNNITVARNSSNIEGDASDLVIQRNGVAMTFVYVDATRGWKIVNSGAESEKDPTPEYIAATGGTETTCGDFKIHTFTGPGTFCVSNAGNPVGSNTVSYLVLAGGGSGARGCSHGAGGGAGGYREGKASSDCYTASPLNAPEGLPVSVQAYPITVGSGGAATPSPSDGNNGSNSVFSTITSTGGGGGGKYPNNDGLPGGSGGGAAGVSGTGGSGNTPPVSPPQGNDGGNSTEGGRMAAGGGAGAVGGDASPSNSGAGGAGVASSINGTPTLRGGGGGGGSNPSSPPGAAGPGGGGAGSNGPGNGGSGTANTGGGGGGNGTNPGGGGAGGSGIVIIRYKYQ